MSDNVTETKETTITLTVEQLEGIIHKVELGKTHWTDKKAPSFRAG